jgi:hypothetical protein
MCQIRGAEAEISVSEVPRYQITARIVGYMFAADFWDWIIGLSGSLAQSLVVDAEHRSSFGGKAMSLS